MESWSEHQPVGLDDGESQHSNRNGKESLPHGLLLSPAAPGSQRSQESFPNAVGILAEWSQGISESTAHPSLYRRTVTLSRPRGPPSPRSRSAGRFIALSPNGLQGEDDWSLGVGGERATMAADQEPPNIIHGASSSTDARCVPRPSSGRTHSTFTDTILLEFLQREGAGTEKLNPDLYFRPEGLGPRRSCPGHRTAHACGANVNLQGQPPDSSLALSSHARCYKQSLALPLPAHSLSGHQISQALGTVKIAPEPTTTEVLLCQARTPARTLRDPWPGGQSSHSKPCQSWGKASNGSLRVAHRGMVSGGRVAQSSDHRMGGCPEYTSH